MLVGLFLITMLVIVPNIANSPWLSALGSASAVVATWVVGNLLRRRRPWAPVARIGWFEQAAYVVVPVVAAGLSSQPPAFLEGADKAASEWDRWSAIVLLAMWQIATLVLVLAVIRLRIISVSTLVLRELFGKLSETATVLARTLPLLLGVITFIFFTAEVWQSIGLLPPVPYTGVLLIFVLLSLAFLARREHLDLDSLSRFANREDVASTLTPPALAQLDASALPAGEQVCELTPRHERTLLVVAATSRLVVAVVVGLAVLVFFLVLGVITVNPSAVKSWSQSAPDVLWMWTSKNHVYALTREHLRVTGFLAVFAGFYYAVVSATDPALKRGLRDSTEEHVRQACAARLVLLERARR